MKRVGQIYREGLAEQIRTGIKESNNVFILNYSSLTSLSINTLRKDLKKAGASMCVSKNRIAKVILKELEHAPLADQVSNQTAFVFGGNDSVEVSKVLVDFTKDLETAKVKGGILDGRMLHEADVQRLSALPSKEVLYSMLLGTIQAPVTRLLGAMNAKSRDLLSILKQLSEKK